MQKLIKNEKQCRICERIFESKPAINQNITFVHKKALLELEKQKSAPIVPLCEALFEPESQEMATASATLKENPE